ncbi:MAG: carboxypeptidase-like regulatory domain-containing protein, partial [Bacteroidales bacterium]|nr:carboxypeptidase-like regulatory domain-containing protein [Bacteroidales bacterium]
MKKNIIIYIISILISIQASYAQTTITGKVSDESGQPLPGVNIRVKGLVNIGTISDLYGEYTLNVPAEGTTLIFSFIGMQNLEIEIAGQTVINATLKAEDVSIDEVVVVAYGIQKRMNVTASFSD